MRRLNPTYVLRRTLQAAVVVALSYVLVFIILYVLPGDPIRSRIENPDNPLSDAEAEKLLAFYSLDKSLFEQFLLYTGRMVRGDFGYSLATGLSVNETVFQAFPSTAALASLALLFSLVLSAWIAVFAVFAPWESVRSLFHSLPAFFLSFPTFVSGLLLIQLFSFQLGWVSTIRDEGFKSLVLPSLTLALAVCAPIAQVLIQGLERSYRQPFVPVLRAQGNTPGRIIGVNVFKNGAIPTITLLGLTIADLLAGSVVTEVIFVRRGIGYVTEQAVTKQDSPVVLAVVLLISVMYTLINLATDLVYPYIDPRIDTATVKARKASTAKRRSPSSPELVGAPA